MVRLDNINHIHTHNGTENQNKHSNIPKQVHILPYF